MKGLDFARINAVIFDLDSTLVNTFRYPLKVAEWLLSKTDNDVSRYEEFVRQLVLNYFKGIKAVSLGAPYTPPFEIVRSAMRQTLIDLGMNGDEAVLQKATHLFKRLHVDSAALYPGVKELLRNLSMNGKRLGVITNSFEDNVNIILRKLDIFDCFIVTVDGSDVQAFKPLPAIFEFALQHLNSQPDNTLYVGDEFWADIVGASSIGMPTVWVNHRGFTLESQQQRYDTDIVPTLTITSLDELNELL